MEVQRKILVLAIKRGKREVEPFLYFRRVDAEQAQRFFAERQLAGDPIPADGHHRQ